MLFAFPPTTTGFDLIQFRMKAFQASENAVQLTVGTVRHIKLYQKTGYSPFKIDLAITIRIISMGPPATLNILAI